MTDKTNTIVHGVSTAAPTAMLMSALLSIAYYGVIELNFRIFLTFKRRRGLYFWSLLVATWGVAFNCTGYILKFFKVINVDLFSATLIVIGWTCMVTGQSVVLYSRLHLVLFDHSKIRAVLVLIITNACLCHIPVSALVYGVNSSNPTPFLRPYEIYERIQLTVFAAQEMFISSVYIYYTYKFFGKDTGPHSKPRRTVMRQLIVVNILIIALDIVILCLQYTGFYDIQTSFKAATYSIKLKLEFDILNHLLQVTRIKRQSFTPTHVRNDVARSLMRNTGNASVLGRRNTAPVCTVSTYSNSVETVPVQNQGVMRTGEAVVRQEDWSARDDAAEGVADVGSDVTSTHSARAPSTSLVVRFEHVRS